MSTVSNHNNAWHEIKTNKYWHALQCTHFENLPLGLFMVMIIVIIVKSLKTDFLPKEYNE